MASKYVRVELVPSYTLTIDGEKVPGFVKTSAWEGFVKFEHEQFGTIILSTVGWGWDVGSLSDVVQQIFSSPPEGMDTTMQVMKVSPLILDLMNTISAEQEQEPEEEPERADTTETEEL